MTVCCTHPGKSAALLAVLAFGLAAPLGSARACGVNPIVGEICAFAGTQCPPLYTPAQGQSLSVAQNGALYSLVLQYYGGSGNTNFLLPDLRGRMMVGGGTASTSGLGMIDVGQWVGDSSATLTTNNMPTHAHPVTATAAVTIISGAGSLNASAPSAPPTLAPNTAVYLTSATAGGGGSALKGPYTNAPPSSHSSIAVIPVNLSMPAPAIFNGYTQQAGGGASFSVQTPAQALTYCIAVGGEFPQDSP